MSALAEETLLALLTHTPSLEDLAREGLQSDVLPSESLRPVMERALDYYHQSGRTQAPSVAVLKAEFGDLLDDQEVDIDHEPEGTMLWAIDMLKASFVHKQGVVFTKEFSVSMAEAPVTDKVKVLREYAQRLVAESLRMESHTTQVDLREGVVEMLADYDDRVQNPDRYKGAFFGLPPVDEYTNSIKDGELCVIAGGPKTGKSYFLALAALREWEAGRKPVLITLENSIEMTHARIGCLALQIESSRFQRGTLSPEERKELGEWVERATSSEHPFVIVQPESGNRSVEAMVRRAQMLNADTLYIDQLTFIEPPDYRAPRHIQIRDITHLLKEMISTGRDKMPCILAHQINREGLKLASKLGHLQMQHLAEGSEVERTADWVFALYQSNDDYQSKRLLLQVLAARREAVRNWNVAWDVGIGKIKVIGEAFLDYTSN